MSTKSRLLIVIRWALCVAMFVGAGSLRCVRAEGSGIRPLMTVPPTSSRSSQAGATMYSLAADPSLERDGRGRVQVSLIIERQREAAARDVVARLGGVVTKRWPDGSRLQAWLPLDALDPVTEHQAVRAVRAPLTIQVEAQGDPRLTNAIQTEGLAALNADAWHAAGVDGAGVRLGIIDGSYLGINALYGTELPADAVIYNFCDGQDVDDLDTGSDVPHGVACAEILHDVAPGADLYLAKIKTGADFFAAVDWMIAQDVDIISTSFGFFNASAGDGTGLMAEHVQKARDAGILWTTAAGNEREAHWGGAWSDADGDGSHEFADGVEINWLGPEGGAGGLDQAYQIEAGQEIKVYARWDDWDDVTEDFALVLWGSEAGATTWTELVRADQQQNGRWGQYPTEYIIWEAQFEGAYGYSLERVSGERAVNFETFLPKVEPLVFYTPERSLVNLADSPAAVTVGALDVGEPWPQEWYSSEGPTNGPGGTAEGGLAKPDICGYANVSTASYGATFFKGTSSATPHTAGAAALLLCAFPDMTVDDLEAMLLARAIDMGDPGMDTVYGAGRVYLGAPPTDATPEPTPATPTPEPTLPIATPGAIWLYLPLVVRN